MNDNKGLKYLLDQPNLNAKQARWLDFLSEYDFEIQHIKDKENKCVDALINSKRKAEFCNSNQHLCFRIR